MSQPAIIDTTLVDMVVDLAAATARIERAVASVEVTAPQLARQHILESIQSAQGFLAQAEELAFKHVKSLEAALQE